MCCFSGKIIPCLSSLHCLAIILLHLLHSTALHLAPSVFLFYVFFVPLLPRRLLLSHGQSSLSCRDPAKLEVALKNPRRYSGNPRLGVAFELLRFADAVTASIPNLNLPFLIMHGGSDGVTDPDQSRNLHEKAPSKDKTLHIYPSAWHQLLQGEPEPEREEVWKDVLAWLKEKSQGLYSAGSYLGSIGGPNFVSVLSLTCFSTTQSSSNVQVNTFIKWRRNARTTSTLLSSRSKPSATM
ncbi:unnamed protein product, partial [Closterium sp. NIES-53]